MVKRIACLATARELARRCVAGDEVVGAAAGPWVRPVSAQEHEDVSDHERQCQACSDPKLLYVIYDGVARMDEPR